MLLFTHSHSLSVYYLISSSNLEVFIVYMHT